MKKTRKRYKRPLKLWDKERIEREKEILKNFGLGEKREIWGAEAMLRKFRRMARNLAAKKDKEQEKVLIKKLMRLGLLKEGAGLDDVLGLKLEDILERNLQTIVFRKGFANTPKQSRQFITHGHVMIEGRKIIHPSYIVPVNEEEKIQTNIEKGVKK